MDDATRVAPATYTRLEVAARTGISEVAFDRLLAARKCPQGFRVGRKRLFLREEIDAWIAMGCPSLEEFQRARKAGKP